jgi:hypothetical protein
MTSRLSRRSFVNSVAVGIPLLVAAAPVAGRQATPQPAPGLIAVTPHQLRDTLIARPFEATYRHYTFATSRWANVSRSPFFTAVGAVNVTAELEGSDYVPTLGAYVVYLDDVAPHSGMFHARKEYEDDTIEVAPQQVEGYDGETIVYKTLSEHDLTMVPVGNVLVIGYDTLTPRDPGLARSRSVEPAAILVRHLETILQTPT